MNDLPNQLPNNDNGDDEDENENHISPSFSAYIDNGNVSEEESSDGNVSDGDCSSNEDDDYVSPKFDEYLNHYTPINNSLSELQLQANKLDDFLFNNEEEDQQELNNGMTSLSFDNKIMKRIDENVGLIYRPTFLGRLSNFFNRVGYNVAALANPTSRDINKKMYTRKAIEPKSSGGKAYICENQRDTTKLCIVLSAELLRVVRLKRTSANLRKLLSCVSAQRRSQDGTYMLFYLTPAGKDDFLKQCKRIAPVLCSIINFVQQNKTKFIRIKLLLYPGKGSGTIHKDGKIEVQTSELRFIQTFGGLGKAFYTFANRQKGVNPLDAIQSDHRVNVLIKGGSPFFCTDHFHQGKNLKDSVAASLVATITDGMHKSKIMAIFDEALEVACAEAEKINEIDLSEFVFNTREKQSLIDFHQKNNLLIEEVHDDITDFKYNLKQVRAYNELMELMSNSALTPYELYGHALSDFLLSLAIADDIEMKGVPVGDEGKKIRDNINRLRQIHQVDVSEYFPDDIVLENVDSGNAQENDDDDDDCSIGSDGGSDDNDEDYNDDDDDQNEGDDNGRVLITKKQQPNQNSRFHFFLHDGGERKNLSNMSRLRLNEFLEQLRKLVLYKGKDILNLTLTNMYLHFSKAMGRHIVLIRQVMDCIIHDKTNEIFEWYKKKKSNHNRQRLSWYQLTTKYPFFPIVLIEELGMKIPNIGLGVRVQQRAMIDPTIVTIVKLRCRHEFTMSRGQYDNNKNITCKCGTNSSPRSAVKSLHFNIDDIDDYIFLKHNDCKEEHKMFLYKEHYQNKIAGRSFVNGKLVTYVKRTKLHQCRHCKKLENLEDNYTEIDYEEFRLPLPVKNMKLKKSKKK